MKQKIKTLVILVLLIISPSSVYASEQSKPDVLIVEIQTGSAQSASEEFIEIYNTTDDEIDVSGWRLEYYSATTSSFGTPSKTISLNGSLYASGRLLIASSNYLTDKANVTFSAGLAKLGGHLRLVSPDSNTVGQWIEHDLIGWGTAQKPETLAAIAPAEGTSLTRIYDVNNQYIDTNNNNLDFEINNVPTPESNNIDLSPEPNPTPEPEPTPVPDPTPEPEPTPEPISQTTILEPVITELFPNPAMPQTDDEDEFVELYNPNNQELQLKDYKLQTGKNFSYNYEFKEQIIPELSYVAFYSKETNLTLSNSGSQARLINSDGNVVATTNKYDEADENMSWSKDGADSWKWTTQPTPSAPNIFIDKILISKKSTTKKSTSKKAKVASTKTKKPKTSVKKAVQNASEQPAQIQEISPLHPWIIAGVAIAVIIYGVYEYRSDISNKIFEFKTNRSNRIKNRGKT